MDDDELLAALADQPRLKAAVERVMGEREGARSKARIFWGTIKLYIRSQGDFTERQNEQRIANALQGSEWLEKPR